MKITIHCDDEFEARRALGGVDAWLVLRDVAGHLREIWKYGDDEVRAEMAKEIQAYLFLRCEERHVDLDDDVEVTP